MQELKMLVDEIIHALKASKFSLAYRKIQDAYIISSKLEGKIHPNIFANIAVVHHFIVWQDYEEALSALEYVSHMLSL